MLLKMKKKKINNNSIDNNVFLGRMHVFWCVTIDDGFKTEFTDTAVLSICMPMITIELELWILLWINNDVWNMCTRVWMYVWFFFFYFMFQLCIIEITKQNWKIELWAQAVAHCACTPTTKHIKYSHTNFTFK